MSRRRAPRSGRGPRGRGRDPGALAPERAPRVEVTIDDLDHAGRGVGRAGGKVVFVADAVPGDRARVRLTRTARRRDEGVIERLEVASPDRVTPFCPVFGTCGGCTLQQLAPGAQRGQREAMLQRQLERDAGRAPEEWLAPITGPERHYRRRARLAVAHGGDGVRLGFRERGGRRVVDLPECGVLDARLEQVLPALRRAIAALDEPGSVRSVELAAGDAAIGAAFHVAGEPAAADRARLGELAEATGLRVLAGDPPAPVDAGAGEPLRYGLPDEGLELAFGVTEFVQANAAVNRALVARVLELLGPSPGDEVIDLFCGIGNFALPIAARGARVTGLEGAPALVERAQANARDNGLEGRAAFRESDLGRAPLARWLREQEPAAVVLDPPREGAPAAVEALVAAAPPRIVYVSCDPATLGRDTARLLGEGGYRLRAAGLADMFPHTGHVEAVALLERQRRRVAT